MCEKVFEAPNNTSKLYATVDTKVLRLNMNTRPTKQAYEGLVYENILLRALRLGSSFFFVFEALMGR